MGKALALIVALLLMLSVQVFSVQKAAAVYYYNFAMDVVPAFPNMHDDVGVTVSLETACFNYGVNFSAPSQAGNDFFATVDIHVPEIGFPAIGYAEETYVLGKLASGYYSFQATVRVWDGPERIFLLESQMYNISFAVEAWSGVVPDDYPTIQDAINHAMDDDTIFVRNGTYSENVVVNKSVSIVGEDRRGTFANGSGVGNVFHVVASKVTIRGFSLGSAVNGVYLVGSNNSRVRDNIINDVLVGGIVLESSCNNTIEANVVSGGPSIGIAVVWGSEQNTIRGNEVIGSHDYGFDVIANNNLIAENLAMNNVVAFYVVGLNNSIFHNNVVGNEVQVIGGELSIWDNGCEGNYWGNYNGTDLDGDGIGDTCLPWGGVDSYPLMNLYWNPGDIDHDLDVDIFDVVEVAIAYGMTPLDFRWNPHCDIARPYEIIDIFDLVTVASSYGESR